MVAVSILISYLLGSVMFSLVIGKLMRGVDIRKHGSGNAGATNALRVLGVAPAIAIFTLDMLKGMAAIWIGEWLNDGQLWAVVGCGLAVIIGHNWPIFYAFRGGKGIATTIGVVALLSFVPSAIAGAIAIGSIFVTRYVSLGSLIFTTLMPIVAALMNVPVEIIVAMIVIFVLAVYRHRSNIVRLLKGEENKLGSKGKA